MPRKDQKPQRGIDPNRPPPNRPPYQGPPIPETTLPDLNTAEEVIAMENYLDTQKKRLAGQGIIPALPEGVRTGEALALFKKVVDFCENSIDKIEIGLTLRKN